VGAFFEQDDSQPDEREIRSLSDQSGTPLAQVRTLFSDELARLKMGAKVGSYLGVLTTSNVRGMLRRKQRLAADVARSVSDKRNAGRTPLEPSTAVRDAERLEGNPGLRREHAQSDQREPQQHLRRWEDDGGRGSERATAAPRTGRRANEKSTAPRQPASREAR
jgi:hypothetical protein